MWIGATVVLFLAAVAVGFVWLPSAQRGPAGLWDAICRAVGLPSGSSARVSAGRRAAELDGRLDAGDARAAEARRSRRAAPRSRRACNNCHGANGISADAIIPNLAGQSAAAIYKQLEDFKSGKRNAMVMGVFVAPLVAAADARPGGALRVAAEPAGRRQRQGRMPPTRRRSALVEVGAPLRGIAPCAACHGPLGHDARRAGLARPAAAPTSKQQMQAFKAGSRHNDISEQMRSVARQLSDGEIAMLAAYYSGFARVAGQ